MFIETFEADYEREKLRRRTFPKPKLVILTTLSEPGLKVDFRPEGLYDLVPKLVLESPPPRLKKLQTRAD